MYKVRVRKKIEVKGDLGKIVEEAKSLWLEIKDNKEQKLSAPIFLLL